MGKFQLNKKGEDPIKIYEDVFKISRGTIESHLDKLGKQPKPISREVGDETLNVLDQFIQVEVIASEGKDAYGNYDAYSMPPASGYTGRNWDEQMDQKIIDEDEESL